MRQARRRRVCPRRADRGDGRPGTPARAAGSITDNAKKLVVDGLFTCVTNVNFNKETVDELTRLVHEEAKAIADAAGIEVVEDYDMATMWSENEDIRSLKSLILFGIRGVAAYAYHARVLGATDETVDNFFFEALAALA